MFSDDWRTNLSSYKSSYPKGWLDPVSEMFDGYIKEPCIDDARNGNAVTDAKASEDDGGEWECVFLFWRKPGLIPAKV